LAQTKPGLSEAARPSTKPYGRAVQALDRLCDMAASLCNARAAVLLLNQDGVTRVVASAGVIARLRSYAWDFANAPYAPDETLIVPDASGNALLQAVARELGLTDVSYFLRLPIEVASTHVVGLLIFGGAPGAAPDAAKRKLLDQIAELMRQEFASVAKLLTNPSANVTVARTLDEIKREIASCPIGAALLDQKLTIVAMNDRLAAILGGEASRLVGKTHQEVSPPSADALGFLYRRALETRVSPPDFEVVVGGGDEPRQVFQVIASPFSPIETPAYFIHVTVDEITGRSALEDRLSDEIDSARAGPRPVEPSMAFLMDTLVQRRTIRARKAVNYLTLRSWRAPVREYQMKALKALKQNIPHAFPESIATEIAGEVQSLVGAAAFKAIVPVPCGHSKGSHCLSVEIARALSVQLNLPVVQAFAPQRVKGVSHPKENVKRPPLQLSRSLSDPVLLVDDVATSGAHIAEAVTLLRPESGSVMAIAWIGGDSAGDE
jgi:PAS domain-containing protein